MRTFCNLVAVGCILAAAFYCFHKDMATATYWLVLSLVWLRGEDRA